jgi:hypothetical protein
MTSLFICLILLVLAVLIVAGPVLESLLDRILSGSGRRSPRQ